LTGIVCVDDVKKFFDGSSNGGWGGSKNELTRQKVLDLLQGRRKKIEVVFSTFGNTLQGDDPNYLELAQADVIRCVNGSLYCKPRSNGQELIHEPDNLKFRLLVGYRIATEVVGFSKIDQTNAIDDVIMTAEIVSTLYTQYQRNFDSIFRKETNRESPLGNQLNRVRLRLYDDGWRVEKSRDEL
jgi:hypothetical protein